jgi:hypothetical protein
MEGDMLVDSYAAHADERGVLHLPYTPVPPVPRVVRHSALRPAVSHRALVADARQQARLARGRDAFVWRGRMLPIGLPLTAAAGLLTWRRRRDVGETIGATLGVFGAALLASRLEWSLRRRAYTRRRDQQWAEERA